MEEDALWPLQRDSHNSATDGAVTNECDKEVGQLDDCYVGDVVIATPTL